MPLLRKGFYARTTDEKGNEHNLLEGWWISDLSSF
jgi:hypothetical protein